MRTNQSVFTKQKEAGTGIFSVLGFPRVPAKGFTPSNRIHGLYSFPMPLLSLILLFAFIAFGVAPGHAQETNALTAAEESKGWQLMFDGKSLAGWHSYQKTNISTGGWAVNDSAIYRRDQAAGAILSPEKFTYQDFEISIDWKIPDNGNSGIFIRYLETESSENIRTGPESQICGRLHPDYESGTGIHSPGACYAMYPPARPWIHPADQYNTFRVVVFNKRVAHFGNGVKLLEYEIGSSDWIERFQASKYQYFPLYGDVHAGKLFLQDHGSPVWFRNLKIRPLTVDPWTDSSFQWPDQTTRLSAGHAGMGFHPVLRVAPGSGRLDLVLPDRVQWELGLSDLRGARFPVSAGYGVPSLTTRGLKAGTYILAGNIAGSPYSASVSLLSGR
ncbi:MAG: hypothetical protein JWO30_1650 [Fibrobacteres bacterium]|nr:hypothetical protein [Fibrobacterota bacterium]